VRRRTLSFVLALWALVACERSRSEPSSRATAPSTLPAPDPASAESTPGAATPFPEALTWAAPRTLVAIGDLHGDLEATRRALRLAGAIDAQDRWRGGSLVVVQTGDAIDRGDDDRAVLELIERLRDEAKAAGGQLIALSGNHELMNALGDFRYVSPASLEAFSGEAGRREAFAPGGRFAALIARRPLFAKVGDTLFVHGGILPRHVTYGLARMQAELQAWLSGQLREPPVRVLGEDGPVWTRLYSAAPTASDCAALGEVLTALGASRMVVGHTVQPQGINAACDGRVYRIDTGLSRHYGGPLQVLAIEGGTAKVRAEP